VLKQKWGLGCAIPVPRLAVINVGLYSFVANDDGIALIAQVGSKNQAQPTPKEALFCDVTAFGGL
jgi:hypothetical protein